MLDEVIFISSFRFGGSRLRDNDNDARSNRRRSVALDPRAKIMGRVLMAVFIRITELMVQFEGGKERRKCYQAQRQRRNEE